MFHLMTDHRPMPAMILPNPVTRNLPYRARPWIAASAFIAPNAVVAGDVTLDQDVFVGFGAVVRGDWGRVYVGPRCNLHDHTMIHEQPYERIKVGAYEYAVHLDGDVSVLHGSHVHGPCRVGQRTFIGQMVNIFDAQIGKDCAIMHGALITGGVRIPDGRFVAPGKVIDTQEAADGLPPVPGDWVSTNASTMEGYYELGKGYRALLGPCPPYLG